MRSLLFSVLLVAALTPLAPPAQAGAWLKEGPEYPFCGWAFGYRSIWCDRYVGPCAYCGGGRGYRPSVGYRGYGYPVMTHGGSAPVSSSGYPPAYGYATVSSYEPASGW